VLQQPFCYQLCYFLLNNRLQLHHRARSSTGGGEAPARNEELGAKLDVIFHEDKEAEESAIDTAHELNTSASTGASAASQARSWSASAGASAASQARLPRKNAGQDTASQGLAMLGSMVAV